MSEKQEIPQPKRKVGDTVELTGRVVSRSWSDRDQRWTYNVSINEAIGLNLHSDGIRFPNTFSNISIGD
jgi:hypothetical protein